MNFIYETGGFSFTAGDGLSRNEMWIEWFSGKLLISFDDGSISLSLCSPFQSSTSPFILTLDHARNLHAPGSPSDIKTGHR